MKKILTPIEQAQRALEIEQNKLARSYGTYTKRIQTLATQGYGSRAAVSELEYTHLYKSRQAVGMSVTNLPYQLARSGVVFSYSEALNIANYLISQNATDEDYSILNIVPNKTKAGKVSARDIANQIKGFSPKQAEAFVSNAIDLNLYASGDSFESYTY